jgi:peptide methionine sulfoxide reductase msrA/msrB
LKKSSNFFFETHDPSHINQVGPDRGEQYQSTAFYFNPNQKSVIESKIRILQAKGFEVKTKVCPVSAFWPAEDYHQSYYQKKGSLPYCHQYEKKF